ncbi:MAG TPA: ABC transporter permease subunit [Stellaceae bacterium]|nr:ABC transporter permease subunit [Stellaceae bacterium]
MTNGNDTAAALERTPASSRLGRADERAVFGWLSGRPLVIGLAALPLAVVLGLILVIVWSSTVDDLSAGFGASFTWRHYTALADDPLVYAALENTLGFVIVTVVVAMGFGIAVAWLVERTDLPGKKMVYSLMTAVLLLPSIFQAMGWMFMLHPRVGIFNTWFMSTFGLRAAPISIANVVGMGWVEGLGLASLAFVVMSPILRALNSVLDEAATVHGIGRGRSFVSITLPLMAPALIAAAIYIAVVAIATFEVPAVIGLGSKIYTFSTLVYIKVVPEMGAPDYGTVGAVSVVLILFSLLLSWWYFRVLRLAHRYEVVHGRNYEIKRIPLGRMRWLGYALIWGYFTLACLLPLVIMVWVALLPYVQTFSVAAFRSLTLRHFNDIEWDLLWRSTGHTLVLMATVPTLSLIFGMAISWVVVRSGLRGRFLWDWIAFLPHAIPNLIFAIAMVIVALDVVPKGVSFYGTIFILMAVYVLVRISLVTRVLNAALVQIHRELEEAAHVSGLSTLTTIWKISAPLLLPAFANLWIWTALLTYRELTMAAFLATHNNITLPVLVWNDWNGGNGAAAAAISLLYIVLFLPLIAVYWGIRARSDFAGPGA